MKKIYSLLAIAAIVVTAACKKTEITTSVTPDDDLSEELVPIQFGLGQPEFEIATKSVGGIDAWYKNNLFILGYAHNRGETVTDFSLANAFIPNIMATTSDGNTISEQLTVLNPAVEGRQEPYYYQGSTVYDFYGYHVDDAYQAAGGEETQNGVTTPALIVVPAEITSNENIVNGQELATGVYVPITINGSQDVMTAYTTPATDIEAAGDKGASVSADRCYSAYAARRDVHPTLHFAHQLTRFTFEIRSGSLSGDDVLVNSISLESPTTGYLCVIGETGVVPADTPVLADLPLRVKNAEGVCEALPEAGVGFEDGNKYAVAEEPVEGQKLGAAQSIGESILVFPGQESYKLKIATKMAGDIVTGIEPQEYTLTPDSLTAQAFEKGKSYKITIIIYGLEKIEITAALEEWEDGGSALIDPDADPDVVFTDPEPEVEPTPGA